VNATAGRRTASIAIREAQRQREDFEPGMVLDERYRLERVLGRGATGVVWEARDPARGRRVAIKVLRSEWGQSDRARRQFLADVRAAASIDHPNLARIYDVGELGGHRLYVAHELVDGENVHDLVARTGPLEVERACRIVRDVALGMAAAHAADLIHGNLKAENVLIGTNDADHWDPVKVVDFGTTRCIQASTSRLAAPGMTEGASPYAPPEAQRRGTTPTCTRSACSSSSC
jgi:serine/threonine-protein kinase